MTRTKIVKKLRGVEAVEVEGIRGVKLLIRIKREREDTELVFSGVDRHLLISWLRREFPTLEGDPQ